MKIYAHKTCGSCKKALKWLAAKGLEVDAIAIAENPPQLGELQLALDSGYTLKQLFNTSGQEYRRRDMKHKLLTMSNEEALSELAASGMLVKRPFLIADGHALVGFKEEAWTEVLG
ncbi:Spx/MgsR family RNA polymerase-binding regulatory protein [Rubritalea marina]|uniref:Spx/MgsR family RNA polymerase-binding regulatory protein n=1 Tax=Rubritalea marina TaxID=361055 RepID=UPI0003726A43|nr:Spx/MgsR family RNA polymerase-binding regulatory protein [Rubritalea marina]